LITENGASFSTGPAADGRVHDERRVAYLKEHVAAVAHAIADGAPVGGYFVWSLLDNFEWDRGYTQRFGMVWVDYATQERVPKDSAVWYAQVISNNSVDVP
jgi:beta-glucosidase